MDLHTGGAGRHSRHHPSGADPLRRPTADRRHVHGDREPSAAPAAPLAGPGWRSWARLEELDPSGGAGPGWRSRARLEELGPAGGARPGWTSWPRLEEPCPAGGAVMPPSWAYHLRQQPEGHLVVFVVQPQLPIGSAICCGVVLRGRLLRPNRNMMADTVYIQLSCTTPDFVIVQLF